MHSLSTADVEKVALLARLKLSPTEIAAVGEQLTAILTYVEQLQAVDTTGVEPMAHPLPIRNVFRADQPTGHLGTEKTLANAPVARGEFFAVPAVIKASSEKSPS